MPTSRGVRTHTRRVWLASSDTIAKCSPLARGSRPSWSPLAAGAAAASIYDEVPGWLRASIFTLVVAAAGALSVAWILIEEEIQRVAEAIASRPDLAAVRIGGERPHRAYAFWFAGVACTALAPLTFLVAAWWAAF